MASVSSAAGPPARRAGGRRSAGCGRRGCRRRRGARRCGRRLGPVPRRARLGRALGRRGSAGAPARRAAGRPLRAPAGRRGAGCAARRGAAGAGAARAPVAARRRAAADAAVTGAAAAAVGTPPTSRRRSRRSRRAAYPLSPDGAGQQDARADQLELQPRRGGAGHLGEPGVDDVGRARQRARRRTRPPAAAHPLELVLGHAAQHRRRAVGDRRDDDEVAQPLEQVLDEPARVVARTR